MARPTFPDFLPTVPGLLRTGHDRHGDNDCLVTPDGRLTYAGLDARSASLAARLVEAGVGKGTHVGILFPNGLPWLISWAAVTRIGAVAVPVNTFYAGPELGRFLRHADVAVLIGVPSFLHHDYLAKISAWAPPIVDQDCARPLLVPELPHLRRIMLWDASPVAWASGDLGAYAHADAVPDPALAEVVRGMEEAVTPGDRLTLIYTSGSTAEPKAVLHCHGSVIRHATNLAAMSELDASSRTWTPQPFFWVGGMIFSLMRQMAVGGATITQEVFEPAAALRLVARERATAMGAWPGISKQLTEHPDFATTDLSSVRRGSVRDAATGAPSGPDPSLTVGSLGMSETCGPHTFFWAAEEVTGAPPEYKGTFGHEVPGMEHRIVDPVTGEDLPDGVEGEVLVRGYSLMMGLYKKERSETFDPDGWYHTDDRGYFRGEWFFFTGRQSDMIKTGGSNVAPAEVEVVLTSYPEVKLAFVVGVPDADRGEQVVALLVPWAGVPIDVDDVRARLKDAIASYKVPRHTIVITDDDVPWLVSQKADRRALEALAAKLVAG